MKLENIKKQILKCRKCRLSKTRKNAVPGEGPAYAKIMLIGQAPGREEDKIGRPFVGRAGKFLDSLLDNINIKRKTIFITSCVKCHPPKNRAPKKDKLEACKPYLLKQIELINPRIIVLMGKTAQSYKKEQILKEKKIISTYHPAAGMRFPKMRKKISVDFRKIRNSKTKPLKNRKK